jgi:acyl phosphate:glycerol-3-phosphate acyltransferase
MRLEYLFPVIGYLLGSIPFGFLLVKSTQGTDIRAAGSGNIGATNVFRKSRVAGLLTLILDGGKGFLAVVIVRWLGADISWQGITAVAAILGHIFTVWLRFKGGKGAAVGCGAFLAISPLSGGTTLIVFVLTAASTRYISLASILATATFPLWAWLQHQPLPAILWAVIGSAFIVAKHHQNIRRLLTGTEHKFEVGRRS